MFKLSILTLLAAASTFIAQPGAGGEQIVQQRLDGFISAHRQNTPAVSIEEFVPQGETVQAWTRMVTLLRIGDAAARGSPLDYARQFVGGLPAACPDAEVSAPEAFQVGGRPAARTWARCPRIPQTGLPESFYMVAIAGAADMHVVQIAFRRVPTRADLEFAARQLDSVRLCSAGSADVACRAD